MADPLQLVMHPPSWPLPLSPSELFPHVSLVAAPAVPAAVGHETPSLSSTPTHQHPSLYLPTRRAHSPIAISTHLSRLLPLRSTTPQIRRDTWDSLFTAEECLCRSSLSLTHPTLSRRPASPPIRLCIPHASASSSESPLFSHSSPLLGWTFILTVLLPLLHFLLLSPFPSKLNLNTSCKYS